MIKYSVIVVNFNDGHINSFLIASRIVGNLTSVYVSNKNCNIL
jgi:hypothetical protein